MRKIYLLFMSLAAFATAQQKTGINTTKPQATFDVTAKTENTTNEVEGLLIPRVSKQKALNMMANTITESTMIYVNDLTDFNNPADGTEAKVAEITENGFYHWNGTQWVKDLNKDGSEWVYDPATQQINLKRSGSGDFSNKVYYDTETGQYINTTNENIKTIRSQLNNQNLSYLEETIPLSEIKYKNYTYSESSKIPLEGRDGKTSKQFNNSYTAVNDNETSDYIFNRGDGIGILSTNSNNYERIYASNAGTYLGGSGVVEYSIGFSGQVTISKNQSSSGYLTGILGTVNNNTSGNINNIYGVYGRIYNGSYNGTTIQNSSAGIFQTLNYGNTIDNSLILKNKGVTVSLVNSSKNSGIGQFMAGISNTVSQSGMTKYPNIYGIYSSSGIGTNAVAPDNHYGLYLSDVSGGLLSNYAIHTGKGVNSFGDDVQIRNINSQISTDPNHKVVVADADGTLRVSDASLNPNPASNAWTLNGNAGTDPDNNFIGTRDNKPLNFGTYGSNKMTITPEGRVGIGTDNPNCLFEIKSKAIGTSGVGKYSDITYTYYMDDTDYTNSDPMTLFFRTFGGTESNPQNLKYYSYLYDLKIEGYVNNKVQNLASVISFYKGDGNTIKSDYTIGVSGAFNDFHIHEDHNIGIGTKNPTQKLHVLGNILASGSITPDYVFEKYYTGESKAKNDYQMLSLAEIENYTKTNKHLPGVPSAQEIKDQGGILVNKATEINLEKIEELYLHTIAQEKELKKQEEQLKEKDEKIKNLETRLEKLENLLLK